MIVMVSAAWTDPRVLFLALVCADQNPRRAEFDAIMATSW